ncbi:hypothetical protein LPN04_29460 [Rugamonas sp. A1-17]|nr:hypothetical protein [Rugamonas sp. A1-17]
MYSKVFPAFGKLDVVLPHGFVDDSVLEHKMPTFHKVLPNGNILRLWVDFKDKAKSQYPNSPRFCISVYSPKFERLHDDIEIDEWAHVLIYLTGLEQYNTVHPTNR